MTKRTTNSGGLAHAFPIPKRGCPRPSRVLCERAGLLADIAAPDHRIHGKPGVRFRGRFLYIQAPNTRSPGADLGFATFRRRQPQMS
jgi:hypothetical protein